MLYWRHSGNVSSRAAYSACNNGSQRISEFIIHYKSLNGEPDLIQINADTDNCVFDRKDFFKEAALVLLFRFFSAVRRFSSHLRRMLVPTYTVGLQKCGALRGSGMCGLKGDERAEQSLASTFCNRGHCFGNTAAPLSAKVTSLVSSAGVGSLTAPRQGQRSAQRESRRSSTPTPRRSQRRQAAQGRGGGG